MFDFWTIVQLFGWPFLGTLAGSAIAAFVYARGRRKRDAEWQRELAERKAKADREQAEWEARYMAKLQSARHSDESA